MARHDNDNDNDSGAAYLFRAIWAAVFILPVVRWLWPTLIPWDYTLLWDTHNENVVEWVVLGWPMYAAGLIANIILTWGVVENLSRRFRPDSGDMFIEGLGTALFAGVTEEIAFRWLLFFSAMPGLVLTNCIFGGFFFDGWGLPHLFNYYLLVPLANFTTFGFLEPWLLHDTWYVGAAMLVANAGFRDGHKYQGFWGWMWAWFGGMYFFWVALNHGIGAAIIIHFIYDAIIFTFAAIRLARVEHRDRRWSDV